MRLHEYQIEAVKTDKKRGAHDRSLVVPLLGLAGEAGALLTEYKRWLRDGDKYRPYIDQMSEELGDMLWYIAAIAGRLDLDLGEIATENLAKLRDRWRMNDENGGSFKRQIVAFDSSFEVSQRLPRQLTIDFLEIATKNGPETRIYRDGVQVGEPLTDNSYRDDGYRFHDVFHIAYAMLLGWSPVTRKLLSCKRKDDVVVDQVEDGARAFVTEEAVSAMIFGYAEDNSFYDGISTIDHDLLLAIKTMVRPFEVAVRSAREWEHAILTSFEVWRQIRASGGGRIVADADSRTFSYQPLN